MKEITIGLYRVLCSKCFEAFNVTLDLIDEENSWMLWTRITRLKNRRTFSSSFFNPYPLVDTNTMNKLSTFVMIFLNIIIVFHVVQLSQKSLYLLSLWNWFFGIEVNAMKWFFTLEKNRHYPLKTGDSRSTVEAALCYRHGPDQ